MMNGDVEPTVATKTEQKKQKTNLKLILPWFLIILLSGLLVYTFFKLQKPSESYHTKAVCGANLAEEFHNISKEYQSGGYKDDKKYKGFIDKINKLVGNESDATCQYMRVIQLYETGDYDGAFFALGKLEEMYKAGQVVDSRYMTVMRLKKLKSDLFYYKSIKYQAEHGDK